MYRVLIIAILTAALFGCGGSSTDPDPQDGSGSSKAYLKSIDVK